jgi:hypothetical protein
VTFELTEQQRQGLPTSADAPLRFTDPFTQREYVLLPAEAYDRLQAALDDGLDRRQVGALVEANMREEDAGDPLLELYQQDRKKP